MVSDGPATDQKNDPVIDPTANVRELVEAAIQRQDDLRNQESKHLRELMALRAEQTKELRDSDTSRVKELRQLETARIDAIRAVDVGAVNRAAEVSATQAATLAAQVATSAETLRTQVAAAATAAATALAAALEPIMKDIADLRRAQYEAQGVKAQSGDSRGGTMVAVAVGSSILALLSLIAAVVIAIFR